ncbi:hypothetical protein BHE74_00036662 [Ensete ventricosum]|nr:hypothetical protein GW17_00047895 [Ensete ventricosum]RWW56612.1 hypothetical protein BHE74_00036662 [Ensete ventricosum]RZR88467.1 hypothetical protein BHM03_00016044 [Ensete ventricosum]
MALIDRLHDAGCVICSMGDKITDMHNEIQELRAYLDPTVIVVIEQQAVDLKSEVDLLKFDLEEAERQLTELQQEVDGLHWHLRDSQ